MRRLALTGGFVIAALVLLGSAADLHPASAPHVTTAAPCATSCGLMHHHNGMHHS